MFFQREKFLREPSIGVICKTIKAKKDTQQTFVRESNLKINV